MSSSVMRICRPRIETLPSLLMCLVTAAGRLPAQRGELMSVVPTGLSLLPTRSLHLVVSDARHRCGDEQSSQNHLNRSCEDHAPTSLPFTSLLTLRMLGERVPFQRRTQSFEELSNRLRPHCGVQHVWEAANAQKAIPCACRN